LGSSESICDVTVVIPTHNRPTLLPRAVESVLAQSLLPREIIVVVDGQSSDACAYLPENPLIEVVALEQAVGGAEARNVGVRKASGKWIAFLDDDDEWLPEKLETQLQAAAKCAYPHPVISCRLFARRGQKDDVWPIHNPQKPYSEYLLVRRRLKYGEGLLQTSTLLAEKSFLLAVPFTRGLKKHQDWDWMLRATQGDACQIVFVDQPLVIWHCEIERRVSQQVNWRTSFDWIREIRPLVTKRAYAAFLANIVMPQLAAACAWRMVPRILIEMLRHGRPAAFDLIFCIGPWLVPARLVRFYRNAFSNVRPTDA
jgi:glycosyltransferase involved in cell wall biosynthesis